jgi:hypothetical protein
MVIWRAALELPKESTDSRRIGDGILSAPVMHIPRQTHKTLKSEQ